MCQILILFEWIERKRKSPLVEAKVRTLTPPKHEEVSEGGRHGQFWFMTEEGGREGGKVGSKSCDAEEGMEGIAANASRRRCDPLLDRDWDGEAAATVQWNTATPQMQSCSMQ